MPKDLDTAAQLTAGALTSPQSRPTIIIIDALNQVPFGSLITLYSHYPQ